MKAIQWSANCSSNHADTVPPSPMSLTIVYLFPLIVIVEWIIYEAHRLPINDFFLLHPFCKFSH